MSDVTDQQARDAAKDAYHKADTAMVLIRQHVSSCEKANDENSRKIDKLEAGIGRVHGRIDKLLWAVLVGVVGVLVQLVMPFLGAGAAH